MPAPSFESLSDANRYRLHERIEWLRDADGRMLRGQRLTEEAVSNLQLAAALKRIYENEEDDHRSTSDINLLMAFCRAANCAIHRTAAYLNIENAVLFAEAGKGASAA